MKKAFLLQIPLCFGWLFSRGNLPLLPAILRGCFCLSTRFQLRNDDIEFSHIVGETTRAVIDLQIERSRLPGRQSFFQTDRFGG